jgi:hypothetical protein
MSIITFPAAHWSSATAAQAYLLDGMTNKPGVASSVRRLSATYSGYCLKVRRASDNTELDVGFDANGYVDVSAITTFCSGTHGYVSKWYDQSGVAGLYNPNYWYYSTASEQPQIVNSGSAITVSSNSKLGLRFTAGSNHKIILVTSSKYVRGVSSCYAHYNSARGGVPVLAGIEGTQRIFTHYNTYDKVYSDGNDYANGGTTRIGGTSRSLPYTMSNSYDTAFVESRYGTTTTKASADTYFTLGYTAVNGSYNSIYVQEILIWQENTPASGDIDWAEYNGSSATLDSGSRRYFATA